MEGITVTLEQLNDKHFLMFINFICSICLQNRRPEESY